jgi:hypothetical protein
VVSGFETRLRRLKLDGEQTFGRQVGDAHVTASTAEPILSILPIPRDEVNREGTGGPIPSVIIGRSKQEIMDAFSRAGEEGAEPMPSRNTKVDKATPTPATEHVEL